MQRNLSEGIQAASDGVKRLHAMLIDDRSMNSDELEQIILDLQDDLMRLRQLQVDDRLSGAGGCTQRDNILKLAMPTKSP